MVSGGRFAAGEDPAKREQILDGAWRVFKTSGFDAASMNDITREAGVSKGTIYVYFENKEDLFAALIERHKKNFALSLRDVLAGTEQVAEGLTRFGQAFARQITCGELIPALRSVLAVIDRMPGVSRSFLSGAPVNVRSVLRDFLQHQMDLGALAIDDVDLAARQFIDLSSGTFFKLRLFGEIRDEIPEAEIERTVSSAVRVFMAAYAAHHSGAISG